MVAVNRRTEELASLAAEARSIADRLLRFATAPDPFAEPAVARVGIMDADDACDYLDRLPTIEPKARPKRARAVAGSKAGAILAALRTKPGHWWTAAALAAHADGCTVTHVRTELARLTRRGTIERRKTTNEYGSLFEYRTGL